MTASHADPASTAAVITSNLAKKPEVSGTPAWANRKTASVSASSRLRCAEAPVVGEGVVAVARAGRRSVITPKVPAIRNV